MKNYRRQNSPLVAEILKIENADESDVLKLGIEKYCG
jgi:hypothetical protein